MIMKDKIFAILIILGVFFAFLSAGGVIAQTQTDWIIRDFASTITVNTDSSLLVEETIAADCDNLPNKHGIFRIVPTRTNAGNVTFDTPIRLVRITDFNGTPVKYSETADRFNHTVIWKIGDPDVTVTGLNYYKITYQVKNAIRSGDAGFDEFYWNLSGNFWEIPIEKYSAQIVFPVGISQANSQVDYYTGYFGEKGKDLAVYSWIADNTLQFDSTQAIQPGQGITASVAFPKGIITPYVPGFFEQYGAYLWFLVPIAVFALCYRVWLKYGKDPRVDKTTTPEFKIPENLAPMEMGMLYSNSTFKTEMIAATLVDLAVKKYIAIEEIKKTGIFGGTDFKFTKTKTAADFASLSGYEKALVDGMIGPNDTVLLSSLKNKFYEHIPAIKKAATETLSKKDLIAPAGLKLRT